MSVIRVHKTANYTVMSNHHFKEKGMSLKAKGLLSLMLSLPDDWNYSISGLVKLSKDGKDGVMSALSELEEFGYLTRLRLTNQKGQFSGVEYNIFEAPQQEKPVSAKQNAAKTNEEKSNAAKPPLLNTNSIKELNNKLLNSLNTKDAELLELYKEYIKMRETIKAPLSEKGLEKLIDRCKRLTKGSLPMQKSILETAIMNSWKNVYLPREEEMEIIKNQGLEELRNFYGLDE